MNPTYYNSQYHKRIISSIFFFHIYRRYILLIHFDVWDRMSNLFHNCKVNNKKQPSLSFINISNLICPWKTYSSVSHIRKTTVLCPMGNICINFIVCTVHTTFFYYHSCRYAMRLNHFSGRFEISFKPQEGLSDKL